ncbi:MULTISPECIES: DUF6448 family protein [unclassified Halomonas]|uniref:DUF6448 family protein n=1 Tax=unclassified Halomonas TaxID=2609666 RepID=UPI001473588C|nr:MULTISPECIES: DUF6448 family protein [unclassified Halomonas]MCE0733741.1 DUF6448 family protein [Halomonas sp. G15]QJQ97568.1 hypothetical protein HIR79_01900 [Halomonas sp. PGE1]
MTLPLRKHLLAIATTSALALPLATPAFAHCDALDGPVISEARLALESGDITPVLKWIPADDEAELASMFDKTLEVRALGDNARELADQQFFAKLVATHRAYEGAPFTGIKPAGEIDPAVQLADRALEEGEIDTFLARLVEKFEQETRSAFETTLAARQRAGDNPELGREFVDHYVHYVHYLEDVHNVIAGNASAHDH